jgi:hypothetical protein
LLAAGTIKKAILYDFFSATLPDLWRTQRFKSFFFSAAVFKTEKLADQSVFPNSDLFIDNLLTQACKPDYSVDDIFRRDSHRQAATSYAKFRELTLG